LPTFGLVGIATAATSGLGQRLGDRVAGTVVVRRRLHSPALPVAETAIAGILPATPGDPVSIPPRASPTRGRTLALTLVSGVIGCLGAFTLLCALGLSSDFPSDPSQAAQIHGTDVLLRHLLWFWVAMAVLWVAGLIAQFAIVGRGWHRTRMVAGPIASLAWLASLAIGSIVLFIMWPALPSP
jgi:hypothetical protein